MASPDLPAIKKAIDGVASLYGIEVVGFLRLDPTVVIPAGEMELLRGVRWLDGEVSLGKVQNPQEIMPGAASMIILGKRLIDDRHDVYYRVSDQYTASVETMLLDMASMKVAALLRGHGFRAEEYTSYYLKVWAVLAGLGWIGRSRMFVSKDHGPRLRLKAVLTDSALGEPGRIVPEEMFAEKKCAGCRECIEACPAGAIGEADVSRKKCGACRLNHRPVSGSAWSYCTCCTAACPVGKR
jgi:epoxyqueuosine reductase QueG